MRKRPLASAPPRRANRARWIALAVVVIGATVYSTSTSGPVILDDYSSIILNPTIHDLGNVSRVLSPPPESPVAGRPLVNVAFAINYALGGLEPRGYHVANILLHLTSALLVFGLVRRTLDLPGVPTALGARATETAGAVAVLWAVHPLNSEAVNYLTQRTELMMAVCYLLTLYASVRAAVGPVTGRWQVAAVAACAAGMACKESMVTAPLMVVLFDRVFLFDSLGRAFKARGRLDAGLAASWIVLAALMSASPRTLSAGFATAHVSSWTYLLNQTQMLVRYLELAFWPHALVVNYGWARQISPGDVWPYALATLLLLGATVVALIRWPRAGFIGAWFFLTLAPTSSVVPIAVEVGAERRMYLALAGIIVLVVIGAVRAWDVTVEKRPASRAGLGATVAAVTLAGAIVALGWRTMLRHREYQTPVRLAEVTLERWPTPVAYHIAGTELAKVGRHDEAIDKLRLAAAGFAPARYNLGAELLQVGRTDEAIRELRQAAVDEPLSPARRDSEMMIGRALASQERWPEVVVQARKVLAGVPGDIDATALLAVALFRQEQFEEAVVADRKVVAARPTDTAALGNLGVALMMTGKNDEGIAAFRRVVELEGSNVRARLNLARALLARGRLDEARQEFQAALQLEPGNAMALEGLRAIRR